MNPPFVLITAHQADHEKLEQFRAAAVRYARHGKDNEPELLAQYSYLNIDATELTALHVFVNAAAAEKHLAIAGELIHESVSQTAGNVRIEVYGGLPGPLLSQALEVNRNNGVTVTVNAEPLAGFSRH